jgi:hypothetical protein
MEVKVEVGCGERKEFENEERNIGSLWGTW